MAKFIALAMVTLPLFAFPAIFLVPHQALALASPNVPLDSHIYEQLEKLAGEGLISSDIVGIRPYSRAEAARLVLEVENNLAADRSLHSPLTDSILADLRRLLPREISLSVAEGRPPLFDYNPLSAARIRYVNLDGVPRSYERVVHDPGGEGVFGIGSGLRPDTGYPTPMQGHGSEGTPLFGNNEGINYRRGHNFDLRLSMEASVGRSAFVLLEPDFLLQTDFARIWVNKCYLKLGGGGLELEIGRDANWLGFGKRGNITLTNNARNFDVLKLSSPEPVTLQYLGKVKYVFIISRFDETDIGGGVRRPYFFAGKLSVKPAADFEIGLNIGKQVGGPGVKNDVGNTLRGVFGGTTQDNSNSLAGIEMRYRIRGLGNTEIYGEFSGEDSAAFWPIVESYVAGIFIPRLTKSGEDDFRIEYFWGNRILYSNDTFREGYIYRGMPIGHSQGGAAQEVFVRYSHWFSARHTLALEYIYGSRGNVGRVEVDANGNYSPTGTKQAVERRSGVRGFWSLPLHGDFNMQFMAGTERIHNVNLVPGVKRTNSIFTSELQYRY